MRIGSLVGVLLATLFIVSVVALAIPIHSSVTIETVGQWETLTNAPEPVGSNNGHRIEAMGNYVYFWVANSTGFYRYNPSTSSWETLTSAPNTSSYGTGIVAAKDTAGNPAIYIIAGTTSAIKGFYRYTEYNNSWVTLNSSIPWTNCSQTKPRNGSEFVWDGGDIIYYFPGSGYEYSQYDWYSYTISSDSWSYMGQFNTSGGNPKNGPGNSACLVTIGGEKYIYIQFGTTPSGSYTAAEFWRYQISEDQWTKMAQTGHGADDGADLVWDGGEYLYLSPGAYVESSSGGCNEYEFWRYLISGNTWAQLTDQPSKGDGNGNDDGGASGLVGEYIYKLKGGDGSGSTLASDFYRYQIEPTTPPVGQWENLENAPEPARENNGHRIEAMGNYVYFWVANSTGFYRYNPSTSSWETLTSAPNTSSYGTGIVAAKDTAGNPAIYIIAGTTSAIKGFYRYTEYNNSWVTLNSSIPWTNCSQTKPRNGSEFVWDNGDIIYYFPGSGYTYDQYDWYKYTISSDSWTYMGSIPGSGGGNPKNGPGNSACLVTIGGEKYIFIQFGTTPSGNYTAAEFWRYKISNSQWTKMAQTGHGADDGADLVWGGDDYLYLSPGAYDEGGCNEYEFWRYSISGNTWVELTEQPYNGDNNGNDDGGSAGIVGEYIYRLKGGDGNGSIPASNFYRYQFAEHPPTPIATATGPKGSTRNPSISITYTYTLTPTSVKLYYTKDGGTSWTLAGEDNSVDNTFAYNITSGDGTYGWIAVAIGGGSTENDPPAGGTPPEAVPLILDTSPNLIAPVNGSWENDHTPTFEWSSVSGPGGVTYQIQIDDNPPPMGYWQMDEGSGTTTADSSGNGNTGTLTNGPTWTDGKFGNCLNFDGIDDYVSVPDANRLDFTNAMTVVAWVKLDNTTNTLGIASKSGQVDGEFPSWGLWYNSARQKFGFNFREDDGTLYSSTVPTTGTWYHIAATYDGAYTRLYVNGVLENTQPYSTPIEATDYPLYIGCGSWNILPCVYWDGLIDEVAVYNRALSASEISAIYDNADFISPVYFAVGLVEKQNPPPPMGYWQMDEGSGTTTADSSGNGNNGTLTNGPTWTDGKFGNCLNFDGIDDYVNVPDANSLDITEDFTLMAWIKPQDGGGLQEIMSKEGEEEYGYYMWRSSTDKKVRVGFNCGLTEVVSTTSVFAGSWYHVAGVWDGSNIKIYINGVLDSSTEGEGNPTANNQPLTIGRFWDGGYYKGTIDEVAVYNRALSASEISAIYDNADFFNHTLPDENALAYGTYFWRVRAVDNAENAGNWSTFWTLIIGNRWIQTNWASGPTKPSLQVGTWNEAYDNFYDNDNVNWLDGVRLDNYLALGVPDHVVISEFATRGSSSAYDEFVELYNPTSSGIDISNWIFEYWDGTAWVYYGYGTTVAIGTIPPESTIFPHGFWLWGNNRGYSGPTPDWTTYGNGLSDGLAGSPRGIRLKMPDNVTVIDTVVYEGEGNTSNPEAEGGLTAPSIGTAPYSTERKAQSTSTASSMGPGGVDENSGNAYDSNNNYNDWVRRSSRNPQNFYSTFENPIPSLASKFRSAGWFESSIYDAGNVADWKIISWIENKPSGTSIIVKARTGNDNNPYDGGWSGWYQHDNGAENSLMENGRYVQYRVELSTTDSAKTPKLSQITLIYELVSENIRIVDVSISPNSRGGANGATLIYTVTVTNNGNVSDTYTLDNTDNLGWTKSLSNTSLVVAAFSSDNTTTLSVTIPMGAAIGAIDKITVTANGTGVSDSASCTAQVTIPGVDVTIENALLESWPSQVLAYTIDVHNSGIVVDNIILSYIPDGWPDINIVPQVLYNVMPSEHKQATLFVHVPENAVPCTYKEITVVAESQFSGVTDNDAAQAHVTETAATTYTYVSSYSAVKGTVTDFANQQSADDEGAYSTLAERPTTTSGFNFTEGFEHGGDIPAGWTFNGFGIDSTPTHVHSGTYSASVIGNQGSTNTLISNLIDYSKKSNVHMNFWYRASAATATSWIKVDASIDGGVTWTVPVVAQFNVIADSTYHIVSDDQDLSSLAGKPNVKFRWTLYKWGQTTSYVAFDDITFTATGATTYDMEIYENITGVPSADNHTLEMRYKLVNTNDNFNVQVWDSSAWNTRGSALNSTSWTDWSYMLLGSEVIGGTVQVRFVDVNPSSTQQDNILKDYLRVKNEKPPYCGVDVTIENALLESWPSRVLAYTISVHNSGNVVDNIILSYIPDGWDNITIVPQVLIDVAPFGYRQATLFVHVPDNAVPCTYKEITVVAESQFCGATDNDNALAHVIEQPVCGVDVTIVEDLLESWPSQVLAYTIDVHNSGIAVDNIILSYIPDGWPDINIVPQVLYNVMPSEHRQATLFVHVPDGAMPSAYKEIIIVAESQLCCVTDNDNAMAHVTEVPAPWTGSATFRLVTLYKLNLYKDNLWLNMGSKLVVKFYKYDNTFEDENVIHIFTPPWHVVPENENVAYPGENIGIKKAKLWLVDNENNEISKIKGWVTIRDDLWKRLMEIRAEWPYADASERDALWAELMGIRSQWPYAPSTRDPIWEND